MPIHDQRSEGDRAMGQAQQKYRAVLIVEDDAELRSLTAALLKDEEIDTIECESAEAALAVMLIGGREVAMIFADIRLPGAMDGVDLSWDVKLRWPLLPIILTSGHPLERIRDLPPGVAYMPKPWQPLNVLIATEQALDFRVCCAALAGQRERSGSLRTCRGASLLFRGRFTGELPLGCKPMLIGLAVHATM